LDLINRKKYKMKKIIAIAWVIGLMTGAAQAQNFYCRGGIGAAYGLSYYNRGYGNYTSTFSSFSFDMKSYNHGTGLNPNIGFGYMFSPYIGVELGLNEEIGFVKKTSNNFENSGPNPSTQSENSTSGTMFQIIPAVVITPGFEKVNPYGRAGIIIGALTRVKAVNSTTRTGTPENLKASTTEDQTVRLSGGVALGFAGAVGVDFNLNKNLGLYAEITYTGLNYSPRKGKITVWTVDGVDQLPSKTTKEKEFEFVKKLDTDISIPDSEPDKALKESFPLSNVGINIGVKFKFGGK
jgi:opacity protein-like surface antigen